MHVLEVGMSFLFTMDLIFGKSDQALVKMEAWVKKRRTDITMFVRLDF